MHELVVTAGAEAMDAHDSIVAQTPGIVESHRLLPCVAPAAEGLTLLVSSAGDWRVVPACVIPAMSVMASVTPSALAPDSEGV